jgi:hypothetical protein
MEEGPTSAPLKEVLRRIHQVVEAGERRRVSQVEMASRLEISPRTYLEYLRGTHAPLAMRAVLDMLAMLNKDDLVAVVGEWKSTRIKARNNGNS